MRIESGDTTSLYKFAAVMISVGLILFGCLTILKPFMSAILLAIIFTVSTWPAFIWLQSRFDNRPGLAAFAMCMFLAACFIAPLVFLGSSLVESFRSLVVEIAHEFQAGSMVLPDWAKTLPYVGPHLNESWQAATNKAQVTANLRQFAGPVYQWLIVIGGSIGRGVVQLALGIFISYFLFRDGTFIVARLRNLIERFVGRDSLRLLVVTESTMMSLVYGILGTALLLGALATVGFYIASVPGAPFLGLLAFFLAILPGGPPLVLLPVTIWLFYEGRIGMGIFMAAWSLCLVAGVDVLIRPYFISLGTKMPLILIILGVFGGVISFGFIGLFIGPALLSVAYAMITEWSQTDEQVAAGDLTIGDQTIG